ncbi:MTHFR-domain-containing protein [Fistulina hepatica ATCC 64428]|uniref:MTHFR-domain-containing protein n=1 Tax=Fistulina hepatica ATCC 64428 TaxID=1128425 RepID=A0A0D7AG35_9AGAR|nr:MTHFR-domain-containing protein [Fistulina hepatica ATCC 64428]
MKWAQKIRDHNGPQPFFTFEFFPPRTDQGFENLAPRVARLAALNPLGVSVTWGAGGSTKQRTLDLVGIAQEDYGLDTLMHLTCTNMKRGLVDEALAAAKQHGIQSILALRGDPPRGQEEWMPTDSRFTHGIDLVTYIRESQWADDFCVGVAAYPDGHSDYTVDEETEIVLLKEKVDAGAEFIVTQLFYDVNRFLSWVGKVRAAGISVPIIPSIMPIQTYSSFLRMTKLCGTRVPESVTVALKTIQHDDALVKDYGVKLAIETIRRVTTEGAIPGVHLCTLNLEKSVQRVLEGLQWTGAPPSLKNKLIADAEQVSTNGTGLVVTPGTASTDATLGLVRVPSNKTGAAGHGELNNATSWDEFPNGRFGDAKSPAYGDLGPWGSLPAGVQQDAHLGHPRTKADLTNIFLAYLEGRIPTTPFSPLALSEESKLILPHLAALTRRGWWTVGSQPAVDCTPADDPVVGWGPRNGYVFQKAFVEFFCEEADVRWLERHVRARAQGWIDWIAADVHGRFESNLVADARNAVTWGVFPGQEIVQTTIIERESFESWKTEAFSIWSEWASHYKPDSEERKLLEGVRDRRWLVSIVHHDYKKPNALWTFLLSDTAQEQP